MERREKRGRKWGGNDTPWHSGRSRNFWWGLPYPHQKFLDPPLCDGIIIIMRLVVQRIQRLDQLESVNGVHAFLYSDPYP